MQIEGTSIGVSCNDDGEYVLKVPNGYEDDTLLIRSVGYESVRLPVSALRRRSQVKLRIQEVQLQEVQVESYRMGNHLLKAAIDKIPKNYHRTMSCNTFFYRDWRSLDGELYLFDEAVMNVTRRGYTHYDNKRGYLFDPNAREMNTDYKTLLRHRLLVYDRRVLEQKIGNREGVDEVLVFSENELFFDLLEAPKANFPLALRWHYFDPVQEFIDNGVIYYLVRAKGVGRYRSSTVCYEYVIRKSDLAIVRITSNQLPLRMTAPQEPWVGTRYNKLVIDNDSSSWNYDVRDGHYTLTHYYNNRRYHLTSRYASVPEQRWQQCVEWTLTDFSSVSGPIASDTLAVRPQTLMRAFGDSDYNSDYWGHYNTVPIDTLPLRMLSDKLTAKTK